MLKDQHTGDAAGQAGAGSDGEVSVSGQKNQQHADRERGGGRQLDHQHRKIAGAQELRREQGKQNPNAQQHGGHGERAQRAAGHGWRRGAGGGSRGGGGGHET